MRVIRVFPDRILPARPDLAGAVRFGGRTYRDQGVEAALRRRPGRRGGGGRLRGSSWMRRKRRRRERGLKTEQKRSRRDEGEERRPASYVAVASPLLNSTVAPTDSYQIRKIVLNQII